MLKFKGCPKCQGTLALASDMYGRYVNCLQCGFTRDLPDTLPQPEAAQPAGIAKPALPSVARKAA